jgi:hypothetical protein
MTDELIKAGDLVKSDGWSLTTLTVVDVNWALRAVAVKLGAHGATVIWPISSVTKDTSASALQVPLGYAVFWGIGEMRPHPHMFESVESAETYAKQIKSVTEVRPVYCHPVQPLSDVQAFKAYTQGTGMQLPNLGKWRDEFLTLVRAVEAAHGIGEKK